MGVKLLVCLQFRLINMFMVEVPNYWIRYSLRCVGTGDAHTYTIVCGARACVMCVCACVHLHTVCGVCMCV